METALPADIRAWRTGELNRYCGGPESGKSAFGHPSKMPGLAYGIPAAECITGTTLRDKPGTVCAGCYAYMRGNYKYRNVLEAQYRRLESITRPQWAEAIAELIRRAGADFFRWHDSGDIQSLKHMLDICRVARMCPDVEFWIPTREYRIIGDFRRGGHKIPANLQVRVSAHMLGGRAPDFGRRFPVSTVSDDPRAYPNAYQCPARFQDNSCGDCRACWDRDVRHVNYHLH